MLTAAHWKGGMALVFQHDPVMNRPPVNPVDVEYVETLNNMEIRLHVHNSYQIIYICEGSVEFTINRRVYHTGADSLLFISNLESHRLKVLKFPYKRYLIQIRPDCLSSFISEPRLVSVLKNRPDNFKHMVGLEREESARIAALIRNMLCETTEKLDFSINAAGTYLQQLLITLFRNHKQSFPLTEFNHSVNLVMQVQKYLEEHILDQVSLKDVSKEFYTDMYYLSHLFKKISGYTFREYLILQRISRAKDLLVYGDDNMTQVAMNSGFGNVNHFIRIFKKLEGVTPLQYRKGARP